MINKILFNKGTIFSRVVSNVISRQNVQLIFNDILYFTDSSLNSLLFIDLFKERFNNFNFNTSLILFNSQVLDLTIVPEPEIVDWLVIDFYYRKLLNNITALFNLTNNKFIHITDNPLIKYIVIERLKGNLFVDIPQIYVEKIMSKLISITATATPVPPSRLPSVTIPKFIILPSLKEEEKVIEEYLTGTLTITPPSLPVIPVFILPSEQQEVEEYLTGNLRIMIPPTLSPSPPPTLIDTFFGN
jgi:hypothetical protein